MVHAVHNCISPGAHIGRPLRNIRKQEEETLPEPAHSKGAVCGIPVLEKGLAEQGKIPQYYKKKQNNHIAGCRKQECRKRDEKEATFEQEEKGSDSPEMFNCICNYLKIRFIIGIIK